MFAAELISTSPVLGMPTLGQRHHLEASGIALPTFAELPAEGSVHPLKAIGIGTKSKLGRPKAFESALANELMRLLELELRSRSEFPKLRVQKYSVRFVEGQLKLRGLRLRSAKTTTCKIVSPVHQKLRAEIAKIFLVKKNDHKFFRRTLLSIDNASMLDAPRSDAERLREAEADPS